ncbi:hypothetical protein ACCAA_600020 [Candidatus Accumulibacter aalborgensis]|uniref:Uncharacterized protein n=1 Tax=Candidatus Accumulibacter aalborgensis TaxID=1860102 RepID=A0A1A8XUC4_9PROT|nr:hypothetical protein ACCAA_600020 [Candidatus Accumulibacter aalborgensis]
MALPSVERFARTGGKADTWPMAVARPWCLWQGGMMHNCGLKYCVSWSILNLSRGTRVAHLVEKLGRGRCEGVFFADPGVSVALGALKNIRCTQPALIIIPATYRGAPHRSREWSIRGTQCRRRRRDSGALGCGVSSVVPPEGARALAKSPEPCRERGAAGTMIKAHTTNGEKHELDFDLVPESVCWVTVHVTTVYLARTGGSQSDFGCHDLRSFE